ncbi:tRNA (N6-isopentenyl adenosine(37)-C2)-methylthiotransferase MiaB [Candidatus Falkowbacteria bacterium]|nr:tRNA (N6-isopentenyl adenosine(37)-C2)-methylthiotransferase MiaB [Candidatus Falkowbacteria bacterium]NCT55022.1 tRNA (N6-isopentenyl adenosine(37)-C2)-methylthiotransferase MiaB [Candidatus Falkowbacteria bacterium]
MQKKYFIITIGCQMNISDSERLAAFLEGDGFKLAKKRHEADLLILNTCGVRQAAEDRIYGLINTIRKENKEIKILITGCLSKRQDVMKRMLGKVDWFLPVGDMALIPALFKGDDNKLKFSLDSYRLKNGEKYLKVKPKYKSSYSVVIPIGNGCNNFCSYCVVPYARGREVYRPAKDIIEEVKNLIKLGYKEIILVAQNVNSYQDEKYNFAKLLSEISKISGNFWLRFFSSHPKDMSDELIKVIGSSDKICHHLHLALQSGDDKILEAMNRKYNISHYKKLIKKVRMAKPGIAITTDIIVGFPGETKAQFLNTFKVFKEISFEMAYLSQYSPRPGTVSAEKMKDDVSKSEKKRRFEVLNEELKKVADDSHKIYLNKELEVLVDGFKKGKYFGKSSSFKTVLIDAGKNKLSIGDFVKVKITRTRPFGLEGKIITKIK